MTGFTEGALSCEKGVWLNNPAEGGVSNSGQESGRKLEPRTAAQADERRKATSDQTESRRELRTNSNLDS